MADTYKKLIRTRLAPSPTGPLHIGTARTALFNWLFSRQKAGKFILRIEDTDIERSDPKYEADITNNLKWLGLNWDEFYRQSERLDIYEKYLKQLLDNGKAYYCFCLKEELEEERQAQLSQGLPPRYSGRCRPKMTNFAAPSGTGRHLSTETSVIRFLIPEAEVVFKDLIRGPVKFNAALFGDIVIAKDLRTPLYNFAAVIDDETMRISHVIRGEDHLPNTPKQILIQQALDFNRPVYAHLPLILNPDRSKLSKRYAAAAVEEYKNFGYLPEAMINFLALLGWHPENDREFFDREALIKEFSLSRAQKAGAVFNSEKLDWLNSRYIKNLNTEDLTERIAPFAETAGWRTAGGKGDGGLLGRVVKIERERLKKLADFPAETGFFFKLPDYDKKLLIWPRPISPDEDLAGGHDLLEKQICRNLKILDKILNKIPTEDFIQNKLTAALEPVIEKNNKGAFLWPLRAALSGLNVSPGPFEILEVLGKAETIKRLEIAIQKLGG